jgi:hypothetical protein
VTTYPNSEDISRRQNDHRSPWPDNLASDYDQVGYPGDCTSRLHFTDIPCGAYSLVQDEARELRATVEAV